MKTRAQALSHRAPGRTIVPSLPCTASVSFMASVSAPPGLFRHRFSGTLRSMSGGVPSSYSVYQIRSAWRELVEACLMSDKNVSVSPGAIGPSRVTRQPNSGSSVRARVAAMLADGRRVIKKAARSLSIE